jgi:hypothetical protein
MRNHRLLWGVKSLMSNHCHSSPSAKICENQEGQQTGHHFNLPPHRHSFFCRSLPPNVSVCMSASFPVSSECECVGVGVYIFVCMLSGGSRGAAEAAVALSDVTHKESAVLFPPPTDNPERDFCERKR